MTKNLETATLAGGCFWCIETILMDLKGVESVLSGYSGGHMPNPTYKQVCEDITGHAEAVQIMFDPSVITYADLLRVFFTIHDPTTIDRQGNDVGSSYRSAIYYHNELQKQTAVEIMKEISDLGIWKDPIVTELKPLESFYAAEDYHQNYYKNNPSNPYCRYVIEPKVSKFRTHYLDRLK